MVYIDKTYIEEFEPSSVLAGCINIYENIWENPDEDIVSMESEIDKNEKNIYWNMSNTINNFMSETRSNYDLNLNYAAGTGSEVFTKIYNKFYRKLVGATFPYVVKHRIDKIFHEQYNILKYSAGQEFKSHYDGQTETGRAVSAILYLNDDYVGGHLEFENFGIKIKPSKGSMIIFPSNFAYSHAAHPVISGTKYAIVTWLHDREDGTALL
jgi:hypothetical protein